MIVVDDFGNLLQEIISSVLDVSVLLEENSIMFSSNLDLSDIDNLVSNIIKETNLPIKYSIKQEQKPQKDWINEYKKSVRPSLVGEFYIHPSWTEPEKNKTNIIIDPSLIFGTGEHETTQMCLELIQKFAKPNETCLDLGCGSGILGIALAKKSCLVDICDTDELAVKEAIKNFDLNSVNCRNSWIGTINQNKTYDLIVANIVCDILILLKNDMQQALSSGSLLILSGILSDYSSKLEDAFCEFVLQEKIIKNNWISYAFRKK